MSVEIFRFDDVGYEAWLRAHRHDGYVVNARQRITPAYLKLHTAWCDHINTLRPPSTTWTGGTYVKVCASSRSALERWAHDELDGELQHSCYCLST
jgi:hypothetical protein